MRSDGQLRVMNDILEMERRGLVSEVESMLMKC